jgi:tagaturonate reductase
VNFNANLNIRILQFGEGNFLRAFIGDLVDELNSKTIFNGGIVVVQPIPKGLVDLIESQKGVYTLFLNGIENGETIQRHKRIDSIVACNNPYEDFSSFLKLAHIDSFHFIVSNTTEAGITYDPDDQFLDRPPNSFPAKLTRWLWERWFHFQGNKNTGVSIIPCELINNNADTLKEIIFKYVKVWALESAFSDWLKNACTFHNSLVDRIVSGYPKENEASFKSLTSFNDQLMVVAEPFFQWVIEGNEKIKAKLPLSNIDLQVKIVENLQSYRTRKVRILNGAHTSIVSLSLLYGNNTVLETMENEFTKNFIKAAVFEEIVPYLEGDISEGGRFANAVFERFKNPFVDHYLESIVLNSISKFKVRVLPSILIYNQVTGKQPLYLSFAFACLIRFYKGTWEGKKLPIQENPNQSAIFISAWHKENIHNTVVDILKEQQLWDQDLSLDTELVNLIETALIVVELEGIEKGFQTYLKAQQQ